MKYAGLPAGMVMKRPLLVGDSFVLTGFKEPEWEEKLLK